jgi:hypothetical protein
MNMQFMTAFVRACGLYNLSGVIVLLTPGVLPLLGVAQPDSAVWLWLPSILGVFAGIVLFFSSQDLVKYGTFPFWNGIMRLVFVIVIFALAIGGSAGTFFTILALGDMVLAFGCIFGLPRVTNRSPLALLTNR